MKKTLIMVGLYLVGCGGGGLAHKKEKVHTGMTMAQVEEVLGKPGGTESATGMKTIWIYREGESRLGVGFGEDDRVARVDFK